LYRAEAEARLEVELLAYRKRNSEKERWRFWGSIKGWLENLL